ncbi:DMT family transporter [Geovibrio thiophilus]|uniref:DMT family transporter n=1 Tax=Geovibrio thiophilus TaxID=139438 RepID=A0A410K0R6_9BACT|nr:DMT family transporter [Geovibrio thiophilus]QAR33982.1 DMT family transporter [Geovibrio thiophilus]
MKQAFIALHLSIFVAGFTGLFGRLITLDAGVLVWWRVFVAALCFYIILKAVGKFKLYSPAEILQAGAVGAVMCLHWVLFYGSIKASNVSVGVVCFSLTGFFTALVEPLMLRIRFNYKELFYGCFAVAGILLIFHFDSRYRLGIGLGVVSSLVCALAITFNKLVIPKFSYIPLLTFYEIAGGMVFLSFLAPAYLYFFGAGAVIPDARNMFFIVILAVFCTIGLQLLQIYALKRISAFTVNLSYNLEPVYTIILAAVIFREMSEVNASFFAGLGIIILSVLLQMRDVVRKGT